MTDEQISATRISDRTWQVHLPGDTIHIVGGATSEAEAIDIFRQGLLPPPLCGADVSMERDRRISHGQTITTAAGVTMTVQTRNESDMINLNGLVTRAMVMLTLQQPGTITFRDQGNTDHTLTPAQMIEVGSLVAASIDRLYKRSWALKDAPGGIPADFTDDRHWA